MGMAKFTRLENLEIFGCFIIWGTGIVLSLYHIYAVGQVFDHLHHDKYKYEDFKRGWSILGGRFQDQADYEWKVWTELTIRLLPWLILNLLGAEFFRYKRLNSVLPMWYTGITTCFLLLHVNYKIILSYYILISVFYICIAFKSYFLIWVSSFLIRHFYNPQSWADVNEDHHYLAIISSSWMILRCISYSVDKINANQTKGRTLTNNICDIFNMLGYSLYLPTMFNGPFISHHAFDNGLKANYQQWTFRRVLKFAMAISRCLFWYTFTQFALHFIYVNAILLRPYLVQQLTPWQLAGLGIAMGHFFHLKYVVFYGLPCSWAGAENYSTPKSPCCVSRVHLYSYMWKNFDRGLYEFLLRFIYVPLKQKFQEDNFISKLFASMVCFLFVYVWHGEEDYVFYWVFFNFFSVMMEFSVKEIYSITTIKTFVQRNLSESSLRRLVCLVSAPLHYFSMVSNYFFIGNGMEIGEIYLNQFFNGSAGTNLIILFFLYGAGQSSTTLQIFEERNKVS